MQTGQTGTRKKTDQSLIVLFLSNIVTIIIALWAGWQLADVMWVYWAQSVIIGFYNWRRMRALKNFSTSGFTMNDRPVPETEQGKKSVAGFFLLHYGIFHVVYLVFLFKDMPLVTLINIAALVICVGVFIYNHHFSYHYNIEQDAAGKPNLGTIMFMPYVRIVPMHLMIVVGANMGAESGMALLMFLGMKTVADMLMHIIEHNLRRSAKFDKAMSESKKTKQNKTL